ncbi:hypothetical protein HJFPF1_05177 [Paramyrothecium foliicola]|nr:hypothetical protein HJFPF1_05177 [Paramyrothecium foliicola]
MAAAGSAHLGLTAGQWGYTTSAPTNLSSFTLPHTSIALDSGPGALHAVCTTPANARKQDRLLT